jgi:hypothetical protein
MSIHSNNAPTVEYLLGEASRQVTLAQVSLSAILIDQYKGTESSSISHVNNAQWFKLSRLVKLIGEARTGIEVYDGFLTVELTASNLPIDFTVAEDWQRVLIRTYLDTALFFLNKAVSLGFNDKYNLGAFWERDIENIHDDLVIPPTVESQR